MRTNAITAYPEWFLFPSTYPDIIVGYSYGGLTAREDAASTYAAYNECIVKGTLEFFDISSRDDVLQNSNYFYYFSPDSLSAIERQLIELTRFDVDMLLRDYVAAFAMDSIALDSVKTIHAHQIEKPPWIDQTFFMENDYYYGVGMYTSKGSENDAWKTAEEQAVFTILTNIAVEVHKIDLVTKETQDQSMTSSMEEITFLKLHFGLKNIEICQRYPDIKNQLYYVLARIAKHNVSSPMLQ